MRNFFEIFKHKRLHIQVLALIAVVLISIIGLGRSDIKPQNTDNKTPTPQITQNSTTVSHTTTTSISTTTTTTSTTTTSSTTSTTTTTIITTETTPETYIETEPVEEVIIENEQVYSEESEKTYLGTFKITHYCPCSYCCGEYTGITASGAVAVSGHTIGMSSDYPFGTQIEINGTVYTVEDRGGFSENTIDIYCDTHEEALEKGCYYAEVYMIN